jgi:cation diffusion facilitator family transporter
VITFILTLITARLISRPATLKYPYGFGKAETVATKALSFVLFFAGFQFLIAAIQRLIQPEAFVMPGQLAVIAALISIAGKYLLARYQMQQGEKIQSDLLMANARNMQGDILISLSVLVGLIATLLLKMPLIDLILAILIGGWIIRVAFRIFMDTNTELMDGVDDPAVYARIFEAVESVDGAHNPHRLRTRKIADSYVIALDIEVEPSLRIAEGHHIAKQVEEAIKMKLGKVFDILVHLEPLGNIEDEEQGLDFETFDNAYAAIRKQQKNRNNGKD